MLWSRNGRELFYRQGNRMMVVDVSASRRLTLSTPRVLLEQRYAVGTVTFANYDIAPDGQHFVMVKEEVGGGASRRGAELVGRTEAVGVAGNHIHT